MFKFLQNFWLSQAILAITIYAVSIAIYVAYDKLSKKFFSDYKGLGKTIFGFIFVIGTIIFVWCELNMLQPFDMLNIFFSTFRTVIFLAPLLVFVLYHTDNSYQGEFSNALLNVFVSIACVVLAIYLLGTPLVDIFSEIAKEYTQYM